MSQQLINAVTKGYMKNDVPEFRPGDTLRVHVRIKEGGKERIQIFEGLLLDPLYTSSLLVPIPFFFLLLLLFSSLTF